MNSFEKLSSLLLLTASVIVNTACSLEDGTHVSNDTADLSAFEITNPAAAVIDTSNSQALAIAGTESIVQATNNDQAAFFAGSQAKIGNESPVQLLTVAMSQQMVENPSLAIIEDPNTGQNICDSGKVELFIQTKTLTADNCSKNGTTINGTATYATSTTGTLKTDTYVFSDLTIIVAPATTGTSLNFAIICETQTANTPSTISCSYKSLSTGIDSRTYITSVIAISGDNTSGYTATTTVNDPVHGNVNVTTTAPVTLNCPNGQPGTGAIRVTTDGSIDYLDVTFNSCTSYSVQLNGGSAISLTW